MGENSSSDDGTEFEWLHLRKALDEVAPESFQSKFARKFKENPLVPIGATATAACLAFGLWNFRLGNSAVQQKFMRARVLAQGFTVTAFIVGLIVSTTK